MPDTSNYNTTRCPKCFQLLTTWLHHDPIPTPNGYKYQFDENGQLVPIVNPADYTYKGFLRINADVIKELQDNRATTEASLNIIPLTIFTPVESDPAGFYVPNIKHIQELRDSTEKILTATGVDKETYFNFNDEGVECRIDHQLDWIDPILTDKPYLIKDMHIEDLRRYLGSIWFEPWDGFDPLEQDFDYAIIEGTQEDHHDCAIYDYFGQRVSDVFFNTKNGEYGLFGNGYTGWSLRAYPYGTPTNWWWRMETFGGLKPDSTGLSSKFVIHQYQHNISGGNNTGGILLNEYHLENNGNIYPIRHVVTPGTQITMDSSFAVGYSILNGYSMPGDTTFVEAIIDVYFEMGGYLVRYHMGYAMNHPVTDWTIWIAPSDLNNFHRNLYDDFTTVYGVPPVYEDGSPVHVDSIWYSARCMSSPTSYPPGMESILSLDWEFDNIKLT